MNAKIRTQFLKLSTPEKKEYISGLVTIITENIKNDPCLEYIDFLKECVEICNKEIRENNKKAKIYKSKSKKASNYYNQSSGLTRERLIELIEDDSIENNSIREAYQGWERVAEAFFEDI